MVGIFDSLDTWHIDDNDYGRDPKIRVDRDGQQWVVWIAWDTTQGECLRASCRTASGDWCTPFNVTPWRPRVIHMDAASWQTGVLVAWIDGGDKERDGLKLIHIRDKGMVGDTNLVLPERRLPSYVAIASDNERFFLVWTTRLPVGSELSGYISDDPLAEHVPMRISHRRRFNMHPSVELAGGSGFVAWEYLTFRAGTRLFLRKITNCITQEAPVELIGNDGGAYTNCTLRRAPDGLWIAWQSDMDPHLGPQLVRWVDVGHLDMDGTLNRPVHAMKGVERNGSGEDQGFEFPSLVVCDDGRLVVIGRGSQSLRRQDLTTDGWTERGQVDREGWNCRSTYDTALSQQGILVASREGGSIVVRLLPVNAETGESSVVSLRDKLDFSQTSKGVHMLGRRVLFGDIHQHTAASDGTGTQVEAYNRARYRYGDDIVAVADHESFLGKQTPPGEWARYCTTADDFYEPGEFVTLYAYEWTGAMHPGPGHKVVYPPSSAPEMFFSRDDRLSRTSAGLLAQASRFGALVFPHHVGWTGADMQNHDDQVQTCFEMVSCHGAYEALNMAPIGTRGDDKAGQFIGDALDAGLRFGFVGGSDGHGLNWHHGVCRMEDSHRSGLTAVLADEITREAVLDALARRRCYATSGTRIGMWFEIDGLPMGEVVRPGGIASYRVVINATAPIASLTLVTHRQREIPLKFSGRDADVHGTLPPPPDDSSVYYYVRVVQEDGHCAWSSPIWLESHFNPVSDRLIG